MHTLTQHDSRPKRATASRRNDRRGDTYAKPRTELIHPATLHELIDDLRSVVPEQQARLVASSRLWYVGNPSLLRRKCVAIVGTREVSQEGAARSRRLARELVGAGVVVISGLAKGVDTEALTAAMEAGGSVVAVIGTPVDRAYPAENKALQERIYQDHLLVSQFAPGERVFPSNFPERNKLMAALTDATVIIEAGDTSGTLHQAAECVRLGRWLFIAKNLIDNPTLQWPKRFLHEPICKPLTSTNDVLAAIAA